MLASVATPPAFLCSCLLQDMYRTAAELLSLIHISEPTRQP
mgnify:CR=1 FL=1